MIDQRGGLAFIGTVLDLGPQVFQKTNVGPEFFLRSTLCRSAHDEAAVTVFAFAHHDPLEPLAFLVGRNLAGNSRMVDGRHVHQKTSRERDVAGYAGTLLADGFLGNLHQDLLSFLEQIGN